MIRKSWMGAAFLSLVSVATQGQTDLRQTVAQWASRGALDSAQSWVALQLEKPDSLENSHEAHLILGQLTLRGYQAIKPWQKLKAESKRSPEQAQALYLMGQYQYAAGRYHLAIPEFRDYLRRYPQGDDADRAGYWMANACLHLALTQPSREAYIDTGLSYLKRLQSGGNSDKYYAALANECEAKLLLAQNSAKAADSVLNLALVMTPPEERPAFFLLKAQVMRTMGKGYSNWIDSLQAQFPASPEAQYANRWKGKIPPATSVKTTPAQPLAHSDSAASIDSVTAYWVLQVGSFAQKENAESFEDQLRKQGLAPRVVATPRGNQNLWQVWVGEFKSVESAEKFANAQLLPKKILFQAREISP